VGGGSGTGFYYWAYQNGTNRWVKMETDINSYWKVGGNAGTNPATHFMGTTDNVDLNFISNGNSMAKIGATNTLMGHNIATPAGDGTYNTLLGRNYEPNIRNTASYNTGAGANQFEKGITFNYNTAAGRGALYDLVNGQRNTAIGGWAGDYLTKSNNTLLGYDASASINDSFCTSLGYKAIASPNGQPYIKFATAIGAETSARYNNTLCIGGLDGSISAVRVGIGLTNPLTDLDIRQNSGTFSTAGIKLNNASNSHNYRMVVDAAWDFNWYRNGTLRSYIEDGTGNYIVSSDLRLKKDIKPLEHVLSSVMKLQPKTYQYIRNTSADPFSLGFLAQEVEQVLPDFVSTKKATGYKAISYQNFHVLAIQAIKEQQAMIEEKTKKIDDLYRRLELVEASLN
jgi:hypothetical protein